MGPTQMIDAALESVLGESVKKTMKVQCKKRRRAKGRGKGPQWERDFSRDLSMWWSGGERDDIFWRTQNSGGRATGRKNRSTYGQHGDIQAVDPVGGPLLDLVCFELKCGYPTFSFLDLMEEKPPKASLATWIAKAKKCAVKAESRYWALVWKRNYRDPVIILPRKLLTELLVYLPIPSSPMIFYRISGGSSMFVMKVSDWLAWVTPDVVGNLLTS